MVILIGWSLHTFVISAERADGRGVEDSPVGNLLTHDDRLVPFWDRTPRVALDLTRLLDLTLLH